MLRVSTILIVILSLFISFEAIAEKSQEIKKDIYKEKKKLENVLDKIEEKKNDLEESSLKEKKLLKALSNIEAVIEKRDRAVAKVSGDLKTLRNKISKKSSRIETLKKEKIEKEQWLEKRMVALYKAGSIGPVKALFSSESYLSLLKKIKFMQIILHNDLQVIETHKSNMEELSSSLKELIKDKKDSESLEGKLEIKRKEARAGLKKKRRLLAFISKSKVLQKQALEELEKSSQNLGKMISTLESKLYLDNTGGEGSQFTELKGHLDFPAKGDIVAFYGKTKDPRFNTTIFQKGIELAAESGADIKAIFDGKVLFSDWFKGYGKIMIIDHGQGYYSLSAHASKLLKKAEDTVTKGEVIAKVGETGSLKGPYLYFEIRYKGKPVDPLDWLNIPLDKLKKINKKAKIRRKR